MSDGRARSPRDPRPEGVGGRGRRRDRRGRRRAGRPTWSTPPVPATCMRPGFLYGWRSGRALTDCGELGSIAAAEVHRPHRRPPPVHRSWPTSCRRALRDEPTPIQSPRTLPTRCDGRPPASERHDVAVVLGSGWTCRGRADRLADGRGGDRRAARVPRGRRWRATPATCARRSSGRSTGARVARAGSTATRGTRRRPWSPRRCAPRCSAAAGRSC